MVETICYCIMACILFILAAVIILQVCFSELNKENKALRKDLDTYKKMNDILSKTIKKMENNKENKKE